MWKFTGDSLFRPKLPPNVNSPQSPIGGPPPKPKSKPPSPDTDDLYRHPKSSLAYPSSKHSNLTAEDDRKDPDDDEPRTLVGKKFSRSESYDSEQGWQGFVTNF